MRGWNCKGKYSIRLWKSWSIISTILQIPNTNSIIYNLYVAFIYLYSFSFHSDEGKLFELFKRTGKRKLLWLRENLKTTIDNFHKIIARKRTTNYIHTLSEEVLDLIEAHGSLYKFSNDIQETIQCLTKGDWGLLTTRGGLHNTVDHWTKVSCFLCINIR